jgi:hypothetical protein
MPEKLIDRPAGPARARATATRSDAGERLAYLIIWRHRGAREWITYGLTWTNGFTLAEAERVLADLQRRPGVEVKIVRCNEWRNANEAPRLGRRGARPVEW